MDGGKEGASLACQPPLFSNTCVTPIPVVNSGHSFSANVRRLAMSPPVPCVSAPSHVAASIPDVNLPSVTSSQNMVSVAEHHSLTHQLGDCKQSTGHDEQSLFTSSALSLITLPLNSWQRPYIGMSQIVSSASIIQSVSCTVGSHQSSFTKVPHSISSGSAPSLTNEKRMMSLSVTCPVSESAQTNSTTGFTQLTYSFVGQPSSFVSSTLPMKSAASSKQLYSLGNTQLTSAMTLNPIPHATITQTKVSAASKRFLLSTQFLPQCLINQCSTRNNTDLCKVEMLKTTKNCIRPFKLTCLVRTRFEKAALRYACAHRTAALFPSTLICTTSASFTITTAVTAYTSAVDPAALLNKDRSLEQCDSILQGIQEMRCQFAPVVSTSSQHLPVLQQPYFSTVQAPRQINSCTPVSTRTFRGSPRRERPSAVFRQARQAYPLFRSVQGCSHNWNKTYQEGKESKEEEEWIDVEEVSPQSTHHLYRMTADGTSKILPITITPTDPSLNKSKRQARQVRPLFRSFQGHSHDCNKTYQEDKESEEEEEWIDVEEVSPHSTHHLYCMTADSTSRILPVTITPIDPSSKKSKVMDASLLCQFTSDDNHKQFHHPPSVCNTSQCYSASSSLYKGHHNDLQLKSFPSSSLSKCKHYANQAKYPVLQFVSDPTVVHSQKAHDSPFVGDSIPKTVVTSQITAHKGICGQDYVVQKKVMPSSEQETDDDVQVISVSKSCEMPNFIILSSDSSPEVIEKGSKLKLYSGKKQSSKDSSKPADDISELISSQGESTKDTSEISIVSEKDNNLLDLNCSSSSFFLQNGFSECQTLNDRHLRAPEPDIIQDSIKDGKNITDNTELSNTLAVVEEKSELNLMIPENLNDNKVALKDDNLLDLNHSLLNCLCNEPCGLQQVSDEESQSLEPKVKLNGGNESEDLTDTDLSGASTIIFNDNSELGITSSAKDCMSIVVTNTELDKTPNISKALTVPNMTITREERLSPAVPHNFDSEKENANFKLLRTSSDEDLSPPSAETDYQAHKKQIHGKRLVDEGHRLQIVVSDFIKLNSTPSSSEFSQNDSHKEIMCEMKDKDYLNQNSEKELILDDKTPVSVQMKLKENVKHKDPHVCVLECKELVDINETNSSQPVNVKEGGKSSNSDVEKPKIESPSKENYFSITVKENQLESKEIPISLEEGIPDDRDDFCEFVDVSSTVFVSDGKLIFPIHMLDSHHQGCIQVTPADEIGMIHQYLPRKYGKDCQAYDTSKRDLENENNFTLCDKSETSVKNKLRMIENGEALMRKRGKITDRIGTLIEIEENLAEKNKNSKDKSNTLLEKNEISYERCENSEENSEVIRVNRLMIDNDGAINEKNEILLEKGKSQSKNVATLVQKREILNKQGVMFGILANTEKNIHACHSEQISNTTQMMAVDEGMSVKQKSEILLNDISKNVESPKKITGAQSLKSIVENKMLCCFTSTSVQGRHSFSSQLKDSQVPRKHIGNIQEEPLEQQRSIHIIEDFMEECRIMGERWMKFKLQERCRIIGERWMKLELQERHRATKGKRSKNIILDEWREMEESTMKIQQNANYDVQKPSIMQLRQRDKESELHANLHSTSVSTEKIDIIDKSLLSVNRSEVLNFGSSLDSEKESKAKENKELHVNVELTKENKTGYKVNIIEDEKVYQGKTVIHDKEVTGTVEDKSSQDDREQCDKLSTEEVRIPELHRSLVNGGCERVYRVECLGVKPQNQMRNQTEEMGSMLDKVNPQRKDEIHRNKEVISTDNTNLVTNEKDNSFKMSHIEMEDNVSVIRYQELDKEESNNCGDNIITEKTSEDYQQEDSDKESEVTKNLNEAVRMNNIPKLIVEKNIQRNDKVSTLSILQSPTPKPEPNVKVVSNHMTVKHESTSPICQSLAGASICNFLKRISEKIDQLKIKPRSKFETEHIQCSKKNNQFFDSTLKGFITKHRWVEEGKGIGYRTSQSSASHHHGSVNDMCVYTSRPLDTSNSAVCTTQVLNFESTTVPQTSISSTIGVPLSSSGPHVCSSASDIQLVNVQASTSVMQASVCETKACTAGSQKCNSCASISVGSAQPSSSSSQVPLKGIQASSNNACILPIDMNAPTNSAPKVYGPLISSTNNAQKFSCAKEYTNNVQSYNSDAQPSFFDKQPYTNGEQSAICGEEQFSSSVQPFISGEKLAVGDVKPCFSDAHPAAADQPHTSNLQTSASCVQMSTNFEKADSSDEQLRKYNDTPQYTTSTQLSTTDKQAYSNGENPTSARGIQPCTSDVKSCTSDSQPSSTGAQLFTNGIQQRTCHFKPSTSGVPLSVNGTQPFIIDSESPAVCAESNVIVKQPSAIDAQSTSGGQLATSCTTSRSADKQLCMNILPYTSSALSSSGEECIKQGKSQKDKNVEVSEAEGGGNINSMTWTRKRKRDKGTTHCILDVPLNEVYQQCMQVLMTAGENLLASLQAQVVMGHNYKFSTLQSDHTCSLLNQIIKMRKGPFIPGSEKDSQYRKLLTLHGLVKATDILYHCGLYPAIHSLQQFHTTHQVLISDCYKEVLAELARLQEAEDVTHPKAKVVREQMFRVEQPDDAEIKVLVVARRESQSVWKQLQQVLGVATVALLTSLPEYRCLLNVLEEHSVVVWGGGESLHQLPCSQFSLMVEWEGGRGNGPPSGSVQHFLRQNIKVISLTTVALTAAVHPLGVGWQPEWSRSSDGSDDGGKQRKGDTLTLVAATSVTRNAELHYILTSVYDMVLVERCSRDVMAGKSSEHGWADLLLDERTCVLLQPLAHLRNATDLNQLTCQLVLLSLQCTTCYVILYSQSPTNSGYVFRSSVVKALARLVATCALFHSSDYAVHLLLADNLYQVGEILRAVSEATRSSSTVWDTEEWTTRPWLTPQMSSERFLVSLPCINSITAQVILTAMTLPEVLTLPLPNLINTLSWIPKKVIMMLHKLLHGEVAADADFGIATSLANVITSSPIKLEETHGYESMIVENFDHSEQTKSYSVPEDVDFKQSQKANVRINIVTNDGFNDETSQLHMDQNVLIEELPVSYTHDNSVLWRQVKDEYPAETYNSNGSGTESSYGSLHIDSAFPSQKSSDLFDAKEYLRSVTSSVSTSLDHRQDITLQPLQQGTHEPASQKQFSKCAVISPYLPQLEKGFSVSASNNQVPTAPSQIHHPSQTDGLACSSNEDSTIHLLPQYSDSTYSFPQTSSSDNFHYNCVQNQGVYGSSMQQKQQHGCWNRSASLPRYMQPVPSDDVQYNSLQSHDVSGSKSWQKQHPRSLSLNQDPLTVLPHSSKIYEDDRTIEQQSSFTMPVPPSPQVILRQDGRGHHFPDHYDLPKSQMKGVNSNQDASQDMKKLIYQKVLGKGGQTKLVFQPIKKNSF